MTTSSPGATPLGPGAEMRPLQPGDAEEFLTHVDRGREFVGRFVRLPDVVTDLGSARQYLATYAQRLATDTGRLDGIWSDGLLVGGIMLRTMNVPEQFAELGCWLEPSAVGRGLVTRAARVLIEWAVEQHGIHRLEWRASPQNTASTSVARRLGMQREGLLREHYLHRGKRHDAEVWSLLAPEWRRQSSTRPA
ncbi:GNAT family N-acetyltransferase [Amycolatopsis jiangsuensis]|uniref:RimJ/RimL family protein N-acetyltransferase n=1 Tax=Amycolatopsis jiangsuensis TaxID=1181879 RepID=A0A840ITI7_9PSEU|nr:GNAT family protein [Amycolatopsis jiangsuensis]MBB4685766.1 RimJ/RimL family protein N-acetyltransferase [Amycolatopsis jiangsuensis]